MSLLILSLRVETDLTRIDLNATALGSLKKVSIDDLRKYQFTGQ